METLGPLCFKLNIPNVDFVKNSEKNKARVEKKLQVENLFVCVNEKGDAILFDDLTPISFNFKSKQEKNPTEFPKGSGEGGIIKEVVWVGKPDQVVPGPEKIVDVNGNLAQSLAQEDSVVKPEVEKSENDALTDGNNTEQVASSSKISEEDTGTKDEVDQVAFSTKTDEEDGRSEVEVASGASVEVPDFEDSKNPTGPVELETNAEAGGDNNPQEEQEDPVEKMISLLPGVKVEMEVPGLLTDSTLKVLEGLVPQLDPAQFQSVKAVVEKSLLQIATQSSSGAELTIAVLKRSSQADKFQVLERLFQGEILARVLSRISGFQVMVWSLNLCSEEEVAALTSTRSSFINGLVEAKFAPFFLSDLVRKFPRASAGLLEEVLAKFSPNVLEFFRSLAATEIGLTHIVGWISKSFSDILEDEHKAGFAVKVIGNMTSHYSVLLETLWRSLVTQNMFLPVAESALGSPLVVGMVEAVVSGRCGGEGLRSEVISVLAQHVDALCTTQEGITILKCLC